MVMVTKMHGEETATREAYIEHLRERYVRGELRADGLEAGRALPEALLSAVLPLLFSPSTNTDTEAPS